MGQSRFRVGITRDNIKPNGKPIFDESDFLCVNCPLSDETRKLVSTRQFSLMKPGAYFINTARGPIVDEKALFEVPKSVVNQEVLGKVTYFHR